MENELPSAAGVINGNSSTIIILREKALLKQAEKLFERLELSETSTLCFVEKW